MRLLVVDNYDSFTYNLVHLVEKIINDKVEVCFNDVVCLDEVDNYDRIILSPGPGLPSEAGLLLPLIHRYAPTKPILGVCLGHQAIGEVFRASLMNLKQVYHGVATPIKVIEENRISSHTVDLFAGISCIAAVGRYHSWVVAPANFPDKELEITAVDEQGHIMAMRHRKYNVQGVQFHPESILTPQGEHIMRNWLEAGGV